MLKKVLGLTTACLLVVCSCTKESNEPTPIDPPVEEQKIPINLSMGIETRATDTAFEPNDAVGLYVVNYVSGAAASLKTTGNHVDNMKFTYVNSAWTSQTPIYWKDETTKADFYCFYPYAAVTSVTAHSFVLKADQSTEANHKASDFLWGKTSGVSPTKSAVGIMTNHLFSSAIIKVEPGDGFTTQSLAAAAISVSMGGIKTAASINLATGVATATGTAQTVIPFKTNDTYKALVVPQTVSANNFITVTVDGREFNLSKNFTFQPNKRSTFTVKVSKTSSGVNVNIGAWETDDEDHGGTAI